ncbi:hypothetical protein HDV06_003661 [Boothiomyces sp. JEL0866]|nr:hypothetical protein HDV06_003661 [Boothiomyces sp. JEL0866]
MYTTVAVNDFSPMMDFLNYLSVFTDISSLFSVWTNVILFLQLYPQHKKYGVYIYFLVAVIHFGLCGLWYLDIVLSQTGSDLTDYVYTISYLPYSIWVVISVQILNAIGSRVVEMLLYNTNTFNTDKLNFMATLLSTFLVSIHSVLFVIIKNNITKLIYSLVDFGMNYELKQDKAPVMLKDVVNKGATNRVSFLRTLQLSSTRVTMQSTINETQ